MEFYNGMPDSNIFIDKILKWVVDIVSVIVLALFFITFFCEQTTVVGNSMSDILVNGDKVMINSLSYEISSPNRYDVVLFSKKDKNSDETEYIKRIVGLPGETVQIINGRIYINDKELEFNKGKDGIVNPGLASDKIKLDYDEYFVIGDNWNNSEDSRSNTVSNVHKKEIKGKVWLVSWPFASIKPVK